MASKPNTKTDIVLKATKTILHLLINLLFYMLIIYMVTTAGKWLYNTSYQIFGNKGVTQGEGVDVYIKVDKGESTMNVAKKLKQNKVIDNPYSFYIHAKLKDYPIMPGTFTLNTSMDYEEIFAILTVPLKEEETEESKEANGSKDNEEKVESTKDQDTSEATTE
ncbi:MAG: endolytic transglycosylase MltG [Clostridiales bacterium]|nr:endolytic transglycosylase MltG [Clostridiales bacterium]